ncbi:hypothetical protein ACFXOD_11745 [Streptomyces sp. NPDC059161]|uniref:hypothetical protein n=1 Tax=Streptomyces sp. NPDC059161 TaxID=3346749 RepID=UPI00367FC958
MKWLLLGAVLGLLICIPALGAPVGAVLLAVLAKPFVIAFVAGVVARPWIVKRLRRWAA